MVLCKETFTNAGISGSYTNLLEYLALRQTYFLLPSGNLARVDLGEEWSEIGLVSTR